MPVNVLILLVFVSFRQKDFFSGDAMQEYVHIL